MLNPQQIALVRSSFAQVEPIADAAAAMFYQRLFALDPSLSRLFKSNMAKGKKLMATIGAAVRGLNNLDRLVPVVQQLGVRRAAVDPGEGSRCRRCRRPQQPRSMRAAAAASSCAARCCRW